MKICTKCKVEQDINQFGIKRSYHDGINPWCNLCRKKKSSEHYKKNEEKIKQRSLKYYNDNKKEILDFTPEQKEQRKKYNKKYKEENSERISEYMDVYRQKNKKTIDNSKKEYRKNNKLKINKSYNEWINKDPINKICKKIRNRLWEVVTSKGNDKLSNFNDYIGCDVNFLKEHLEKQFTSDMSWDNQGLWHIDHVVPLKTAETEEEIYKLTHYTNLRPLWASDNLKKSGTLTTCYQKLQRDKLIEEDKNKGFPFDLKASDFTLNKEEITEEHRLFIERYEWLGTCGFGVRYVFTARWQDHLAGVVMIAEPNAYQFGINEEALIQRGACSSWAPKNLNSKLVMFSCNWMVKNTTKRIFVAYSDPEAGEIGTIYQACNFDYLGNHFGSDYSYIFKGKKVGDRFFTRTSSVQKWCKLLNIEWKQEWSKTNGFQDVNKIPLDVKEKLKEYIKILKSSCKKIKNRKKGKYVLLIKNNKREKLSKSWISKPYPKRTNY